MASRRQKGSVIPYPGKRSVVWRIKYADASGRAVMETIGAERHGFTRSDAEAELRDRLTRVEKKRWEKPKPITFRDYQATWIERQSKRRNWEPTMHQVHENVLKLRHTAITNWARDGMPPIVMMVRLATRTWQRRSGTSTWPATRSTRKPRRLSGGCSADLLRNLLPT
jgi:hypothetical protein